MAPSQTSAGWKREGCADAPAAANLRDLYVVNCGVGFDGLRRLVESPYLAGVAEFALGGNGLSPDEARELKARYPGRVK